MRLKVRYPKRAVIFYRVLHNRCTVHSELCQNPFREGGLTGLQRKPLEIVLAKVQSIMYLSYKYSQLI